MAISACGAVGVAFIPGKLARLATPGTTEARRTMIYEVELSRKILIGSIACLAIGKLGSAFCVDNELGFWSFVCVGVTGIYAAAIGALSLCITTRELRADINQQYLRKAL
jgi:hypothetical protein